MNIFIEPIIHSNICVLNNSPQTN